MQELTLILEGGALRSVYTSGVLDVLMKGYRLKGRVIRPAKVKVNSLENEEVEKEEKQEKEND